jgi:CRISPR-associated protein Csb2
MARAFWISATFLTGRYHGEEWPPSPARLVQALVAGTKAGGNRVAWPEVEKGLRWLERQPAPTILARPVKNLQRYRIAVPNNDFDVIAKEWAAGRAADPAKIRTLKEVAPKGLGKMAPHVRYVWPLEDAENGETIVRLLRPAANCLYSLGWGIDMAYADSGLIADEDADGWEEWVPGSRGEQRVVPVPGFLDDLEATYTRFTARVEGKGVDTDTRPSVYRLQRYGRRGTVVAPFITFGLRTLDGEEVYSKPWRSAVEVAAWMRHGAGEVLAGENFGEDLNAFVFGHPEDPGAASHRLSFVPLPSVHLQHGDGRIRRILVAEPLTGNGRATELLGAKWTSKSLKENGREVCMLEPIEGDGVTSFYTRPSAREWRSVTPVVLHGHNAVRGIVSVPKTEKLLVRAFEMAGRAQEQIESMAFQAAPLWEGSESAAKIRVPKHLDGYPRYHVEVRFREPVAGPVLAGIGRHYGIGVFAAE